MNNPDQPISELPLLTQAECHQLLVEFNDTAAEYPRDKTIADLFEEQAEKTPDNVAVIFEEIRLTYRELNEQANSLAHALINELKIENGECVGLLTDRSQWTIAAILGILKAGGAYVPIDPTYPRERISYILTDTKCRAIFTDENYISQISSDYPGIYAFDPAKIKGEQTNSPSLGTGESLAYVMYTSGSTGKPKGSLISHRSILRLVLNTNYISLDESDRILQTGSVAFDASTFEIWGSLLNGGCLCLPHESGILDPLEMKRLVRKHGITTMWLTAGLFNQFAETDTDIFKGLKKLLVGGERLSFPHVNKIREHHPTLTIINGYGPTENTTFTTCHRIEKVYEGDIPIGRPVSNTTVIILDTNDGLVPIGVAGEICTGGDGLARGYLNDPVLTADKFVPNPFKEGERLYRTGDSGRWLPDGTIEYLERNDDQVKIRGYRVEAVRDQKSAA